MGDLLQTEASHTLIVGTQSVIMSITGMSPPLLKVNYPTRNAARRTSSTNSTIFTGPIIRRFTEVGTLVQQR
jgi:hypothetical protein